MKKRVSFRLFLSLFQHSRNLRDNIPYKMYPCPIFAAYRSSPVHPIGKIFLSDMSVYSTYEVYAADGILWGPIDAKNRILELNLQTKEATVHKVEAADMKFSTICFDGSNFWLTGEVHPIGKIFLSDMSVYSLSTPY